MYDRPDNIVDEHHWVSKSQKNRQNQVLHLSVSFPKGLLNVVGVCDDPKGTDKGRCTPSCGGTMTDVTDHYIGR